MLMITQSGLGYTEAARQRYDASYPATRLPMGKMMLRVAVTGIGLSLMTGALSLRAGMLVLVMSLIVVMGLLHQLRQLNRTYANASEMVTVIRSGLMRRVRVADLVAGDSLVVTSGMVLPVDAAGPDDVVTGMLARLAVRPDQLIAGTRVCTDAIVTVTATGNQRLLIRLLDGKATRIQMRQLWRVLGWMMVATLAQAMPRHVLPNGLMTWTVAVHADVIVLMQRVRQILADMFATARLRLTNAEITYRYNQGPVS